MDMSVFSGMSHSVRVLTDLVKANKTLRNFNELSAAVSEVNAKLVTALGVALESQEKQATLTQRIADLEKENVELKNWQREAERYQLTEITPGITAYVMKPGMENDEPAHYLCANCFARNQKSFLQHGAIRPEELSCAYCKSTFAPSKARTIGMTRLTRS